MQPRSVAFGPYNPTNNPYQRLLAEHLRAEDVAVCPLPGGARFSSQPGPWRDASVLHFHWFDKYLIGRNGLWTSLKIMSMRRQLSRLRGRGVKFVWTAHNLVNHQKQCVEQEKTFMHWFLGCCDAVIAHADSARDMVVDHYSMVHGLADRVHVIPHGHYIGCYPNEMDRAAARQSLALPDDKFVFLFIGQVHPYKGIMELIDAFDSVAGDDAVLMIAGKPSSDAFEKRIDARISADDQRIRFKPGFVPDERLQDYLNAADVVVLPFTEILTSGSAVLAMSFAKPVIAPQRGCLPEVLRGQEMLLYDPDDQEGLNKALRTATDQREKLTAFGSANCDRAGQWDWSMVARRTAEVYRGLDE